MNFGSQETNEDDEQTRGVSTFSNDIQANSNTSSDTKIAQCFDNLASQYDSENGQKYYNPKQSASAEDVLTKFDSSGRELYSKYKGVIEKKHIVDKISFPPHPFSDFLKKNPESILAIITDNTDQYLSLKEIHLIKSEFENKIDMIPLDSRLPKIQRSLYYNGYFLLQCMDDFTKNWVIDNFRGNKNVIEGKAIKILNAIEFPNTIDRIFIPLSEKVSFKRFKFFNPDWKLKNCASADNSDENLSFSTALKNVQTLYDSNAEASCSVIEETTNVKIEPDWMTEKNYDSDNKNSISSYTFKNVQALSNSNAEPASSGSEETTSVKIESDWTPEKDDNSDKNSISNDSLKVLQDLHNSNAEPVSFEFEKSTNVKNEELSGTIEHPAINSFSGENFKMDNNHQKTIQDYEQNDNVQEAHRVLKDAKRGLKRSKILKLKQKYENKLKKAIFLLEKKNQIEKNSSPPDNAQTKLTKPELLKLKRKCLKRLKILEKFLAKLNIECKKDKIKKRKEKKKKKNSVDSNKELSSNTCKVNTIDETFSYINSSKHINEILKYCVINIPKIKKKIGKDVKFTDIKELKCECIKNLDYFRVRFKVYHTNSTNTKQLLNRLHRFNPELGCLNWHVLSKYTTFNHITWIFMVKPNGIEALRKARFVGYTGVDRISFRIVIHDNEISKYLESRAQKSGVIGSSGDNNETIPALTDQMDAVETSSVMADSNNAGLSDIDYEKCSSSDNNKSIHALTDQMDAVESCSVMAVSNNTGISDMDYESLDHKN